MRQGHEEGYSSCVGGWGRRPFFLMAAAFTTRKAADSAANSKGQGRKGLAKENGRTKY